MALADLSDLFLSSLDHLREDQRVLQEVLDGGGTKHLFLEPVLHGSAKNLRTMALQDVMQSIHVVEPLPRPAMNDFRQVLESRLS